MVLSIESDVVLTDEFVVVTTAVSGVLMLLAVVCIVGVVSVGVPDVVVVSDVLLVRGVVMVVD